MVLVNSTEWDPPLVYPVIRHLGSLCFLKPEMVQTLFLGR